MPSLRYLYVNSLKNVRTLCVKFYNIAYSLDESMFHVFNPQANGAETSFRMYAQCKGY